MRHIHLDACTCLCVRVRNIPTSISIYIYIFTSYLHIHIHTDTYKKYIYMQMYVHTHTSVWVMRSCVSVLNLCAFMNVFLEPPKRRMTRRARHAAADGSESPATAPKRNGGATHGAYERGGLKSALTCHTHEIPRYEWPLLLGSLSPHLDD